MALGLLGAELGVPVTQVSHGQGTAALHVPGWALGSSATGTGDHRKEARGGESEEKIPPGGLKSEEEEASAPTRHSSWGRPRDDDNYGDNTHVSEGGDGCFHWRDASRVTVTTEKREVVL